MLLHNLKLDESYKSAYFNFKILFLYFVNFTDGHKRSSPLKNEVKMKKPKIGMHLMPVLA